MYIYGLQAFTIGENLGTFWGSLAPLSEIAGKLHSQNALPWILHYYMYTYGITKSIIPQVCRPRTKATILAFCDVEKICKNAKIEEAPKLYIIQKLDQTSEISRSLNLQCRVNGVSLQCVPLAVCWSE